jgi:hypothetical protein
MSKRKSHGGGEFDGNLDGLGPHVLALHQSDTCGYCKKFKPEWKKVVKHLRKLDPSSLTVTEVGPAATDYMNDTYYKTPVEGVPTIMYIHKINNNNVRPAVYTGARTSKAIIEWVAKILAKNNVKITIESNHDQEPEHTLSAADPALSEAPLSEAPLSEAPLSEAAGPASSEAGTASSEAPSGPVDTIKTTAAAVDDKIGEGVSAVKSAFTKDLNFENMFSSKPAADANANGADATGLDTNANANGADANGLAANPNGNPQNPDLRTARINAPPVPSLVGGRKHTRRAKPKRKSNRKSNRNSKRKSSNK